MQHGKIYFVNINTINIHAALLTTQIINDAFCSPLFILFDNAVPTKHANMYKKSQVTSIDNTPGYARQEHDVRDGPRTPKHIPTVTEWNRRTSTFSMPLGFKKTLVYRPGTTQAAAVVSPEGKLRLSGTD